MAAMTSALLVIALLLLGSERCTSQTLACSTGIAGCITAYTASKALNLLNPNSCTPYYTLRSCTQSLVSRNACTQQEVNEYSNLTSIHTAEAQCGANTTGCFTAIMGCIYAYAAKKALNLFNPNSCDPYYTMKSCTQSLVFRNACTQQEVNDSSGWTSIRTTEARCRGTTAKASLIMIVITAVLGLIFKS